MNTHRARRLLEVLARRLDYRDSHLYPFFADYTDGKVLADARKFLRDQLLMLLSIVTKSALRDDADLLRANVLSCHRSLVSYAELLARFFPKECEEARRLNAPFDETPYRQAFDRMAGDPLGLDARALDTRGEIPERNQHPVHFIEIFRQAQMAFDQVAIELNIDIKNKNIADELVRSIVFKPEYKQAGMALLAYFGTIVEKKYPTLDVRIRIEQEGDRVSLIIETPSGEIEKIERELGQYALVVSGDLSVDEYMPDARDAMALRHKLELSRLEVQQTRDLLYIERKGLGDRIASLEGEIGFMRRLLDKTQYESGQTAEALRNIAMSLTGDNREMMRVIADSFETSDQPSVDKLVEQLNPLLQSQPSLANTLKELFVKGSIQGAAGNYLYAALMTLQKMA